MPRSAEERELHELKGLVTVEDHVGNRFLVHKDSVGSLALPVVDADPDPSPLRPDVESDSDPIGAPAGLLATADCDLRLSGGVVHCVTDHDHASATDPQGVLDSEAQNGVTDDTPDDAATADRAAPRRRRRAQ